MNVIQFTVPVAKDGSVVVQEDILPDFYACLHRHAEIQVTLIAKGEGTIIAGNYTQQFKAGEVYVIGANQPHMFKGDPKYLETLKGENIHAIHIFFDQKTMNTLFQIPEFESIKKFLHNTSGSLQMPAEISAKISKDIIKISKLNGLERLLYFTSLLSYFAYPELKWKSLSTGFLKYSCSESEGIRMSDIFQYTLENFSQDISLTRIASIANMTTHSFCKYFKKHTRKTYLSFLNEIRINEACKKMLNGQTESIATTAYTTGFNSTITFNRVFKKTIGLSPSQYLKQFKYKQTINPENDYQISPVIK
jgi:AraC-like DNA-binding protein